MGRYRCRQSHHLCVVIDVDGNRLLSQKIPNDEPALLDLIASVLKLGDGDEVVWATDLNHGGPALLIALLVAHGQSILYIPGRIVHHASKLYRGEGKTDAKDAFVIADQSRMRKDLQPLRAGDEISTGLRILTSRRADKSADRVRAINRLQAQLLEYFPVLERAFDYSRSKAALLLLTRHRTPDGIRRHAQEIVTLDKELAELDALIGERLAEHRHAQTLLSMPGFGPVLAPAPRDSGRITGNHHRPRRYDRKLTEGKTHTQAMLSLARRRLNVLWAPV
ncbi:hypothetical protein DQ354_02615 [Arthrobacter sp. AQ5-06]|nr:hypothetical protein DQ354_02615 [Arthrobacter sp. AQ5-06]